MDDFVDHRGLPLPSISGWRKNAAVVDFRKFGRGSLHPFSWYLEGKSTVKIRSLEDICAWLCRCRYVPDRDLFQEDDFWQHPVTFESLRKGDCADHAMWAWRKMIELGMNVEFVSGKMKDPTTGLFPESGHAWLTFQYSNKPGWFLLETTQKQRKEMIQPLESTRNKYHPRFSVDGSLNTFEHANTNP